MNKENSHFIALGSRLQGIPEVLTLGVKPNFFDYTPHERKLILGSNIILYPTLNYAQLFTTIGKQIFPSLETYLYADEKIKQTTLFYMQGIPHPRTRIYYRLHHKDILKDCIVRLRKKRVHSIKEDLRQKIQKAEKASDINLLKKLMSEYKKISSEVNNG